MNFFPIRPQPRKSNHLNRSNSNLTWGEKVKCQQNAPNSSPQNLLIGASYFERLNKSEHQKILSKYFKGWLNHGIGGDRVEHIAWRILNGCLPNNIDKIIVSIGTNNIGKNSPISIVKSIFECITSIKSIAPTADILVLGIPPRFVLDKNGNEYLNAGNDIKITNSMLKLKLSNICQFYVPNCRLWKGLSANPNLYTRDNVHLNNQGYSTIFNDILPFINSKNKQINFNYIDDVIQGSQRILLHLHQLQLQHHQHIAAT